MTRSNKLLGLCACCVLSMTVAQSTLADFVGLQAEIRSDLTICQDTTQDNIDVPLAVCNFFAVFDDPDDKLLSVFSADIATTDPAGFFQHPFNPMDSSPPCYFILILPTLVCDSFVTIGVECDSDPGGGTCSGGDDTQTGPDFDSEEFNNNGHVVGGWFNLCPVNGQGDAGNWPGLAVLVAQLSVNEGQSVSGTLSLYWLDGMGNLIVEADLFLECPGPVECPADFDGSGNVGAADLAELLGSWGPCPGCPADFDGDGQVGAADLAILLGAWGSCSP